MVQAANPVTTPNATGATRYILDANVFMAAKRHWYRFSFCSGFWKLLIHQHTAGLVTSIDHVKKEIKPGDDLHRWVKNVAPNAMFLSSKNSDVGLAYAEIMTWAASNSHFLPTAIAELASVADGWIVAYAKVHGLTVVTHETHDPNVTARVKIPTICRQFDVDYCNTFKMLQNMQVDFKWP